ncbi:MAG: NAD(P)H-hydrate dehydratase [Coxiellaceae bacterium]|nr:NAD(P)H-hydrate dehydratase [Coxiellaceae bacterium]
MSHRTLDWEALQRSLPKRDRDAHKGRFGHVLIIGGDYGMGGAVRMAAEAACRAGAGLVSVATRPEHVCVVSTDRPEIMCHQVQKSEDLTPLIEKATVIVIGPGLGKTDWAKMLLEKVLNASQPKLLDADALNLLSNQPKRSNQWVLTPHVGEAARLLDINVNDVQEDRDNTAKHLQEKYGGIIVLKGAGTIVQGPEGESAICTAGNPGMASGGMGDVLSGVIGGLLAQGLPLLKAAELGVLVHAMAADKAAEVGGERGLLATDLMNYIRLLVNPEEPN